MLDIRNQQLEKEKEKKKQEKQKEKNNQKQAKKNKKIAKKEKKEQAKKNSLRPLNALRKIKINTLNEHTNNDHYAIVFKHSLRQPKLKKSNIKHYTSHMSRKDARTFMKEFMTKHKEFQT